eukprot:2602172-Amphidinium_carterae.1
MLQELFCKANFDSGSRNAWLEDAKTLAAQNVVDGAIVTVGLQTNRTPTQEKRELEWMAAP